MRSDANPARRLRIGLVVAAILLVGGTAVRAGRVLSARLPDGVRSVEVDVPRLEGGGLLVRATAGGAWAAESWRGDGADPVLLRPGEPALLGGLALELDESGACPRTELMRRDWATFSGESGGHRRIDFGPDPLGRTDGVRDRVILESDSGIAFRIEPLDESIAFFRPGDRAGRVIVESPRLTLRRPGQASLALMQGATFLVERRFSVGLDDGAWLEVGWEEVERAEPLLDADGSVLAYGEQRGADFVVTRVEASAHAVGGAGAGAAASDGLRLHVRAAPAGPVLTSLSLRAGHALLLHGRRDRIGAVRGAVLPAVAPDEPLERAVERGLREGWIRVDAGGTELHLPRDASSGRAPSELGGTVGRSLEELLDDYERARRPIGLRLSSGFEPAAARAVMEDGRAEPLRWDGTLRAWVPSSRPRKPLPVTFLLPVRAGHAGGALVVEAASPLSWRLAGGVWTGVGAAASRGTTPAVWTAQVLDAPPGSTVELRLLPPPIPAAVPGARAPARIEVSVAGGPPGSYLVPGEVRMGRRAYADWPSPDPRAARAAAAWPALEGDRWRAGTDLPLPDPRRESRFFLRVPVSAEGAGMLALDLALPPSLAAASWDGDALDAEKISKLRELTDGRRARLSLPLNPGTHLLALEFVSPQASAPREAGGVRFEVDEEGRPRALESQAVQRRALSPVRRGRQPGAVLDRDGRDAPAVWVERGLLPDGTDRLRASAGAGLPGSAELPGLLRLRTDGDSLDVAPLRAARLLGPDGSVAALPPDGRFRLWPRGARLTLAGSPLLLRRPDLLEEAAIPPSRLPAWAAGVPAGTRLLLDEDLQAAAEHALDAELLEIQADLDSADPHPLRGALLLLDARGGDVLACASRGRAASVAAAPSCWEDLGLHPGSTWKVAVAAAALGSGDPAVRSMLDGDAPAGLRRAAGGESLRGARLPALRSATGATGGSAESAAGRPLRSMLRNFRHAPVDPSLDLERALVASSNTWFGYLGLLMHRSLREGWGDRAIVDSSRREAAWPLEAVARSLGFGEPAVPLGAGVSGEMGRFPATVADDDAPLAARSIGQDEVTATPLGLALLLAAVATDGQVPAPRVSADVPVSRAPLLGPAASARLREALAEVVERGTAARAFADHPAPELVLGKTGSAQRIDPWGVSRTDAWFAGALLPPPQLRDASPVAVVVVLPGAGLGGSHAAELADRIGRDVLAAWGGVPEQIAAFR